MCLFPSVGGQPQISIWSCGTIRGFGVENGYIGYFEYYDAGGKLIGARSYSDYGSEGECLGFVYGRGNCVPPYSGWRTCLSGPPP